MLDASTDNSAFEAGKALDALAALSHDLSCHCHSLPDRMVLPSRKLRDACDAIDAAVLALKRILEAAADRESARPPGTSGPAND